MVRASSYEDAIAWARRGPHLAYGSVLVREIEETPAVALHRFSIERRSRVAAVTRFVAGRSELEDVMLLPGVLDELCEEREASAAL